MKSYIPYKKQRLYLLILTFMFSVLCGCSNKSQTAPIHKSGFALDTFITISIYDKDDEQLLTQCFSICDSYEKMFSRTIPESDISKINAAGTQPVAVSKDTIALLERGIYFGTISQDLFDITIAPISTQWDFTSQNSQPPDMEQLHKVLPLVSYKNIILDKAAGTAALSNPDAAIDLGGIAKGYIADRLKEYLISQDVHSAIIDLGGNIVTIGTKPDREKFHIGIKEPFSSTGAPICAVAVSDKSVVTSGTYQRYFFSQDKLYHHILNPKTGYPADTDLNSVTIISDSSTDGDGLSTTCMLLGREKGQALIESLPNTEAVFISNDNQLFYSSGMNEYLIKTPQ